MLTLKDDLRYGRWNSVELRPRSQVLPELGVSATYCLHTLDLSPSLEGAFGRFHHSCARRAIRRASREGLRYESGSSERLLAEFYGLLRLTRRRHGLPPQPLGWFRNLVSILAKA